MKILALILVVNIPLLMGFNTIENTLEELKVVLI